MRTRWISGALLCGWLGWASAATAQAPLPPGPSVPAPPAEAVAAPAPQAVAQLPEGAGADPGVAAAPAMQVPFGNYPGGVPCYPGPVGPGVPATPRPFEPLCTGDSIAITEFEQSACCPGPCWTVRFEFLQYWTKNRGLPLLVTSGFSTDAVPGAVGQPTTSQVVGGALTATTDGTSARSRAFDANNHSGFRIGTGAWLDPAETLFLEASFFQLFERNATRTVDSQDLNTTRSISPVVLARPFYNLGAFREDAVVVAAPPGSTGTVTVNLDRTVYGADTNLHIMTPHSAYDFGRFGLIFGARYLVYEAGLTIDQFTESTAGIPGFRANSALSERLDSQTIFYGGQAGLEYEMRYGGWVLNLNGKIALGTNREKLSQWASATSRDNFGAVTATSLNNGVVVRPSNAGTYSRSEFSYLAEGALTLGYEFNEWVRINFSYNLLYWDKVLEPEDQIDRTVNGLASSPRGTNGARPTTRLKSDDFYMQGLSAGLQFSW